MLKRKNQLILIISSLLITGFLVTSLVSYFVSRTSLRLQITRNELPLTTDNIYSEIQRDLMRPIFISAMMATDTFLRDWVINGEQDTSRMVRFLKEIKTKHHTFTSFFVSDRTKNYYYADGLLKKVSPEEERDRWYFRLKDMVSDYEINVDPDMANKDTMTIFINYRVYDYDKKFIGATGVGLTVHAVKQLIERYQFEYGRNIFFADAQGRVVLHGPGFSEEQKNIFSMERLSGIAAKIVATGNGAFKYKYKGRTFHLNTRYIPEFGWYLLVEKAEEKAIRKIFNALIINLLICSFITIIIVVLISITISVFQGRLEKMATTDKLTGVFNRQAFDILLSQNLKEVRRTEASFSIILYDIDDFKKINDTFGHLTGDLVLQHITKIVQDSIRESDVLCRWGGEEFIVFLKGCTLAHAFNMAEKIRAAVKNAPCRYKGKELAATISLGIAQHRIPESEDSLLRRVDVALYQAKAKGRDRTEKEPA